MVATKENIEKQRVVQRLVNDWKKRIKMLFDDIKSWSGGLGYTFSVGPKLTMFEEMMAEYGVSPTDIDTADLYKDGVLVLTVKPRGLWITGTNGSIDILTDHGNYQLIAEMEETIGDKGKWKIFDPLQRKSVELNRESFLNLLK